MDREDVSVVSVRTSRGPMLHAVSVQFCCPQKQINGDGRKSPDTPDPMSNCPAIEILSHRLSSGSLHSQQPCYDTCESSRRGLFALRPRRPPPPWAGWAVDCATRMHSVGLKNCPGRGNRPRRDVRGSGFHRSCNYVLYEQVAWAAKTRSLT